MLARVPVRDKFLGCAIHTGHILVHLPEHMLDCPKPEDLSPLPPIFTLSAPRSCSSLFGIMLGEHPDVFGFPEMRLFAAATVGQLERRARLFRVFTLDGLYRAVAQLEFDGQTEAHIELAKNWLTKRQSWSTERLWTHLCEKVAPRTPLAKEPIYAAHSSFLARLNRTCPDARYIHLVRDPRSVSASIEAEFGMIKNRFGIRARWFVTGESVWNRCNRNILNFLATIPEDRKTTVHGEFLLNHSQEAFASVTKKFDLKLNPAILNDMMRPENGPFAFVGPASAPYGNDAKFLKNPAFRPQSANQLQQRIQLRPSTLALAKKLGYATDIGPQAHL
ncbi:sulfotransferase family protein [Shimia abyssi]|uniref:Sulfotransferase family protein n=1 Tax=Shimia abyssi TaxID=1662395 RepID=A0A2P8FFP5_9RHOB|nr:sulfotransferase family protein [Shimia abyssi]